MGHIVYQSKGIHETNITMHEPSNSDKGLKSYRFLIYYTIIILYYIIIRNLCIYRNIK